MQIEREYESLDEAVEAVKAAETLSLHFKLERITKAYNPMINPNKTYYEDVFVLTIGEKDES